MSENRPQGIGVLLSLFGLLLAVIAGAVIWIMINAQTGDPRPWSKPSINGTEVTVRYTAGCVDAKGLKVKETSADVTLTLNVDAAENCSEEATEHTETAVLKQPLSSRRLIDGACLEDEFNGTEACSLALHEPISNTNLDKKVEDPASVPTGTPTAGSTTGAPEEGEGGREGLDETDLPEVPTPEPLSTN